MDTLLEEAVNEKRERGACRAFVGVAVPGEGQFVYRYRVEYG